MRDFISGFFRSVGILLIVCSMGLATTGVMADVVVVQITHNCNVGGSPTRGCTCSGDCNHPQLGQWECICGVIKYKNGSKTCWCGCIAAGSAC